MRPFGWFATDNLERHMRGPKASFLYLYVVRRCSTSNAGAVEDVAPAAELPQKQRRDVAARRETCVGKGIMARDGRTCYQRSPGSGRP
jgi:hypothetical protein